MTDFCLSLRYRFRVTFRHMNSEQYFTSYWNQWVTCKMALPLNVNRIGQIRQLGLSLQQSEIFQCHCYVLTGIQGPCSNKQPAFTSLNIGIHWAPSALRDRSSQPLPPTPHLAHTCQTWKCGSKAILGGTLCSLLTVLLSAMLISACRKNPESSFTDPFPGLGHENGSR